jgi:3-methyladenine DNA glycosylase AlkD
LFGMRAVGMAVESVLREMRAKADPRAVKGMARFGISSRNTLGVSIPVLRAMAKKVGIDHGLAQELWESGIHEARILASMIDDPGAVTGAQMERWVVGFDSWDVCDQCCSNLFDKTPFAFDKAVEWSEREEEFVKRAGFVLMAALSVHDRSAGDSAFLKFLPAIVEGSKDQRNFVKKAVNWALRQIGKRNLRLNREAQELARKMSKIDSSSSRWVASDALRELESEAVQRKLRSSS